MTQLPLRQPLPESGDGRISLQRPPTEAEEARTRQQTRQLSLDNDDRELGKFFRDFWPRCRHFFYGLFLGIVASLIFVKHLEVHFWLGILVGVLGIIVISGFIKWAKKRPRYYCHIFYLSWGRVKKIFNRKN
jgi:hypothetical protein